MSALFPEAGSFTEAFLPPRSPSFAWIADPYELTDNTQPSPVTPFRVRPAVTWPGGKSRLLKHLLPRIPAGHTCYCEPFGGGLAVFLAKPASRLEVINDLDGDLVCFHRDELLTELEFVLNSRQEFHDFRAQPGLTDIQRGARWFHRNRTCFGGANMDTFAVSQTQPLGSRAARMESIRQLNMRLDRATIEHLSWERCLELYDRPGTFFFVDPPYTECKPTMYCTWTNADVQRLRERLDRLRGQWLLTLNDTPAIRAIFADCELQSISRARGVNNRNANGVGAVYRELIISPRGSPASPRASSVTVSPPG